MRVTTIKEFKSLSKDIVITLPKSIKWSDYEKELEAAEKGEELNYKVNNFPNTKKGNKCYICHDGMIKGYMIISRLEDKNFICSSTGIHWYGKFIVRTGKFHYIDPIPMKGFQGFKYF